MKRRQLQYILALLVCVCTLVAARPFERRQSTLIPKSIFERKGSKDIQRIAYLIRGGSDNEEEGEEYDSESEEEYDDEYDEEESDAEEEEQESEVQIEMQVEKYDEPLQPNPMANLFISLGVMMLAKKVDLFSPKVVRLARFAFIAYLVVLQLFLLYVRVQAKSINDRTPITLKNPLSSVLQSQLGGSDAGMMKSLASSFLSSKSTVLEYDLRQARSMQSGLIVNMAFMWFLHFKMNQVQPLIIQTATGMMNMVYSPLFQVYVLGRNLERPFKNPSMPKLPDQEDSTTEEESEIEKIETADASEIVAAEVAAEQEAIRATADSESDEGEESDEGDSEEEVEEEDSSSDGASESEDSDDED